MTQPKKARNVDTARMFARRVVSIIRDAEKLCREDEYNGEQYRAEAFESIASLAEEVGYLPSPK